MKAVILAAGSATRMRPLSDSHPKCLLAVGGKPILQRVIENVAAAGISQIGLVIGYKAEAIRSFVKKQFPFLRIRFVVNPKYESTNNAFSLLMAREFFLNKANSAVPLQDLLLLDADILFSPDLLPHLLSREASNKVAVRVEGTHDEEEVRVRVRDEGTILSIGKTVPLAETLGESIGIEVFSSSIARRLFEVIEQRVRAGAGRTEFYESSFQALIDEGAELHAVDVSRFPSMEIDTPDDLRAAEAMAAGPGFSPAPPSS
ncbi:MAG: phosphocholine cytidylyltransferase family protein [Ignavibacteriales bacterium]|nr:phosphocholine cytidylyltransferase family protein [Ignavibacteriales bacterium]